LTHATIWTNLNALHSKKEPNYERLYTVWLYFYDILEKAKLEVAKGSRWEEGLTTKRQLEEIF
jgi:hypothetical protein